MPPVWHEGSWLLFTLIQINYLITLAFSLAIGEPVVREDDMVLFTSAVTQMVFHCFNNICHLVMELVHNDYTYLLFVVLRITPANWQRLPAELCVPNHPLPNSHLVPPGVPFELPCSICHAPLERDECHQHQEHSVTIL